MTWTDLDWQPVEPSNCLDLETLRIHADLLRSALDEAASAAILGSAVIVAADLATVARTDLPEGFLPVGSFELLGTSRRSVGAALDPAMGDAIGDTPVTALDLARALLQALDGGLEAVIGEGIGLADATELPEDDQLLLIRLGIATASGAPPAVGIVFAVAALARTELATHLRALEALGQAEPPTTRPPTEPVAAAMAQATPTPSGTPPADVVSAPVPPTSAAPRPVPAAAATVEPVDIRPVQYGDLRASATPPSRQSIDLLLGVNLQVTVEIGRTRLPIRDVLGLTPGSIVELDKLAGEKVDVLVNGHQIATGEVVVVDENFGVRITDVVARDRRIDTAALL